MSRIVDIQTVSIAVASASVVAGVIYYSLQIRHQNLQIQHQNKIRETDLLVRIVPWVNISSSELQHAVIKTLKIEYKDYDDFVKRYGELHSEKPEQEAILAVINYFEGLGILVKRKIVDIDLVYDFWGPDLNTIWGKLKPIIEGEKKKWNYSTLNIEYLFNEMKKIEKKLKQKGA